MHDSKVVELTDRLIQTQFAERRKNLSRELVMADSQFASRGVFDSSMYLQKVTDLCTHEVEIRAQIVYQVHVRVLSQLNIEPYSDLARDLKQRVAYFVPLTSDYTQVLEERAHGLLSRPAPSIAAAHAAAAQEVTCNPTKENIKK
jgi:hypothetical protein